MTQRKPKGENKYINYQNLKEDAENLDNYITNKLEVNCYQQQLKLVQFYLKNLKNKEVLDPNHQTEDQEHSTDYFG